MLDGSRFTYAFVDYRGYGRRKNEAGEYTMAEIASDAIATADQLGWGRFSLIGHSMGGKAAARVLTLATDRVDRIVGVSPVPANAVPFDPDGWALFDGAARDDAKRAAIINITTGGRLSPHWIDAMVAYSVEQSTRQAFAAYLLAWAKEDFAADLAGLHVPVQLVVGANDPALGAPVMRQTWMQAFPDAELVDLTDAGHYAMYEAPVLSATVAEEFLRRPI